MGGQQQIAVGWLKADEGFREAPYLDSKGVWTVGYGFNMTFEWPPELRNMLRAAGLDLRNTTARWPVYWCNQILLWWVNYYDKSLSKFYWYLPLNDVRKAVIIDVAYNVGLPNLLHFPKMIAALTNQNWGAAAAELLDSDAARLNVARYARLSKILNTGVA